jgi:hypothetical protein
MGPRATSGDVPPAEGVAEWLAGRLPDGWFDGAPEVVVDREEVLVVGMLAAPPAEGSGARARPSAAARSGRPGASRASASRRGTSACASPARPSAASAARWPGGAGGWDARGVRQPRGAGHDPAAPARAAGARHAGRQRVARSRSEALAWCVRLVGRTPRTGSLSCGRRWSRSSRSAGRVRRPEPAASRPGCCRSRTTPRRSGWRRPRA